MSVARSRRPVERRDGAPRYVPRRRRPRAAPGPARRAAGAAAGTAGATGAAAGGLGVDDDAAPAAGARDAGRALAAQVAAVGTPGRCAAGSAGCAALALARGGARARAAALACAALRAWAAWACPAGCAPRRRCADRQPKLVARRTRGPRALRRRFRGLAGSCASGAAMGWPPMARVGLRLVDRGGRRLDLEAGGPERSRTSLEDMSCSLAISCTRFFAIQLSDSSGESFVEDDGAPECSAGTRAPDGVLATAGRMQT